MKKDYLQRGFVMAFALLMVVTMVVPWSVVSAATIVSDDVIYPEEPEFVADLTIFLEPSDVVGYITLSSYSLAYYFYSFDDLSKCDPDLALMVDYFNQGYYLGMYDVPYPAVSVVGETCNNATVWYQVMGGSEGIETGTLPIMLIGDAGVYTYTYEVVYEGELFEVTASVELPSAGIVVLELFVGWTGYVQVYKTTQENGLISVTGQAFTACISWLGDVVSSLVSGEMNGLLNCLILGVGVSVFIVVVVTLKRRPK